MNRVLALSAIAAVVCADNLFPREHYEGIFMEHVAKYNLNFANGAEFVERLQIFADNFDFITATNRIETSSKMAVNEFTHLSLKEFHDKVGMGGVVPPYNSLRANSGLVHTADPSVALPASVDWSTTPAVTPVKNQGSCGSCWSFSATGAMEGAHYVSYGGAGVSLSEQQFVSCDNVDMGCNGGWMDDAFAFAKKNGGICSETDYPYTSGTGNSGTCKTTCSEVSNTAPKSWTDVAVGDVNALMSAVAQQPVSIAIQANQPAFQSYSSGVLTGNCGQRLDHGVLVVGYGTWTDGTPYWKVKNSWGPSWGMNGYILIERSTKDLCGVLDAPSYPTL